MAADAVDRMMDLPDLQNIDVIVWDLDGTLGPMPGWGGDEPLKKYIYPTRLRALKTILGRLRRVYSVHNVLVSRNGMFCHPHYPGAAMEAKELGFDEVQACSRQNYRKPKTTYVKGVKVAPERILLFDDLREECVLAAGAGSTAVLVSPRNEGAIGAILEGIFRIIRPKRKTPTRIKSKTKLSPKKKQQRKPPPRRRTKTSGRRRSLPRKSKK